jgi:WD40 repeat protein
LKGHTGTVRAVVFTPDGKTLVTAALDGTARVWDLKTGKVRRTLTLAAEGKQLFAHSLTIDPDGRFLVAVGREGGQFRFGGGEAGQVGRLWELSTGKEVTTLSGANWVIFSPDSKTLAVAVGGSRWDTGGGFARPGDKKKKETPDKVMLMPIAEILKGQEKPPSKKE